MSNQNDFSNGEFRPLSSGIGFHKKEAPTSQKPDFSLDLDLLEPLPRKTLQRQTDSETQNSRAVDQIIQSLSKNNYSFINQSKHQEQIQYYSPSYFSFSAGLLDALLVLSASLLGIIAMLLTTKVDLFSLFLANPFEPVLLLSLLSMLAGFSWIYLVGNRIFLGFTPGEWAFDQRLGFEDRVGSASYCIQVALRSTLVILSGFVTFPALSQIFNSDILGTITGAKILKKII